MSWFPKPSSPRAAFRDLAAFTRQRGREQVLGATLAFLVTTIIVIMFLVDATINTKPPPETIYIESWPSNRTDEEIKADQAIDEAAKQEALKERQRQFQELENKLGM